MAFLEILKSFALVSAFTSAANIILMFLLSKILPINVYGDFSYYYNIYVVLGNITPFGLTLAVTVFRYNLNRREYSDLMSEGLFIFLPCVLLFYLVLLASLQLLINVKFVYYEVAVLSFLSVYPLVLAFYYAVSGRMRSYAIVMFSISLALMVGLLGIAVLATGVPTVEGLLLGFLTCSFLVSFVSALKLLRIFGFRYSKGRLWQVIRERFDYGSFVVSSSVAMSLLVLGDKLILRNFMVSDEFGKYAVASLVASTTLFVVNNFASAWGNILAKDLPKLVPLEIKEKFFVYQRYLFLTPVLFGAVVIVQLWVFNILYEEYFSGYWVVVVINSFAYCVYALSKFYIGYMNFYGHNRHVLRGSLFAILVFISLFLFAEVAFEVVLMFMVLAFVVQFLYCAVFVNGLMRKSLQC